MRIYLLLLLLLSSFSHAEVKQITWLKFDFPPYYFVQGEDKGRGRDKRLVELLGAEFQQTKTAWREVPTSSVIELLSNPTKQFCAFSLYKTPERQLSMLFSQHPSTINIAPVVAMRQTEKNHIFASTADISMHQLLDSESMTLGVSSGRSFGNELDKVINRSSNNFHIFRRSGVDALTNLLDMLYLKRLDMVIGYPDELGYLIQRGGYKQPLLMLRLVESPEHSLGYIGCNKNEWGKQAIEQLNQILVWRPYQKDYQDVIRYWLPENLHPALTTMRKQYMYAK